MSLAIAQDLYTTPHSDRETIATHLGAGVSRDVYRSHVDGNAYKVTNAYEDSTINLHEAAVSAFFRSVFHLPGVIWPNFIVHEVGPNVWVTEVTYFEHDSSVPAGRMQFFTDLLQAAGVADADPGRNVFSCKGFIVPIDLGYHALISEQPWTENYWTDRAQWMGRTYSLASVRDDCFALAKQMQETRRKIIAEGRNWDGRCTCSECHPFPSIHSY